MPDRQQLSQVLADAITRATQHDDCVGLLIIDVDQSHIFNQILTASNCRRLLDAIGERLQHIHPSASEFFRLAGDRFALIIGGDPDAGTLSHVADRISQSCREPFTIGTQTVYISVTTGASLFPTLAADPDQLITQADTALHRGKRQGKNCYLLYSQHVEVEEHNWAQQVNALHHGLANDEFDVDFQPQIDLIDGRICGFEALARWHSATLGDVSPEVFIPVAEGCGQIGTLSNRIITKAMAAQAHWLGLGHLDMRLAVNLSARQLHAPECISTLKGMLDELQIPPELIDLEVTESVVGSDPHRGNAILRQLSRRGFRIVLDNFGTRHSSMASLGALKADAIKIDKSFVLGLQVEDYCAAAVKAIITLARTLDIAVIAEGVETAAQLGFLHQHGCERLQGYYFSKPLPATDVLPYLVSQQSRSHRP